MLHALVSHGAHTNILSLADASGEDPSLVISTLNLSAAAVAPYPRNYKPEHPTRLTAAAGLPMAEPSVTPKARFTPAPVAPVTAGVGTLLPTAGKDVSLDALHQLLGQTQLHLDQTVVAAPLSQVQPATRTVLTEAVALLTATVGNLSITAAQDARTDARTSQAAEARPPQLLVPHPLKSLSWANLPQLQLLVPAHPLPMVHVVPPMGRPSVATGHKEAAALLMEYVSPMKRYRFLLKHFSSVVTASAIAAKAARAVPA